MHRVTADEGQDIEWTLLADGSIFGPDGQLGRIVPVPAASVLSVCFMGTRLETLVVTTMDNTQRPELGGCAFAVDVGVAGTPVGAARV